MKTRGRTCFRGSATLLPKGDGILEHPKFSNVWYKSLRTAGRVSQQAGRWIWWERLMIQRSNPWTTETILGCHSRVIYKHIKSPDFPVNKRPRRVDTCSRRVRWCPDVIKPSVNATVWATALSVPRMATWSDVVAQRATYTVVSEDATLMPARHLHATNESELACGRGQN